MTDWYLWDGARENGPMDREELDSRVRTHPKPETVRVWRDGFSSWRTVEDAFGTARNVAGSVPDAGVGRPAGPTRPRGLNFIALHWRGDYPLGISCWVFGPVGLIALVGFLAISNLFVEGPDHPVGFFLHHAAHWAGIVGIVAWQNVGIWRSARRRIDQRAMADKGAPWAVVAQFAVCAAALGMLWLLVYIAVPGLTEASRIAFLDDPEVGPYSITVTVAANGAAVNIRGGIKAGLADDVEKTLKASKDVRIVRLESLGGRVGEAAKLNRLIRARRLDTYVDRTCQSACTLIYVAGRNRFLKRGARLGFHSSSYAGIDSSRNDLQASILTSSGVSDAFVKRVLETRHSEMWEPSDSELLEAGVVTMFADNLNEPNAGLRAFTREDWDQVLQTSGAVYPVLKQKFPAAYNDLIDTLVEGTRKGLSLRRMFEEVIDKTDLFVKARMPYADDAALADLERFMADRYRALQALDRVKCYHYIVGKPSQRALSDEFPDKRTLEELELQAKILSATGPDRTDSAKFDETWAKALLRMKSKGYSKADFEFTASGGAADPARYCDLTVAMFDEISSLSVPEIATIARGFYKHDGQK